LRQTNIHTIFLICLLAVGCSKGPDFFKSYGNEISKTAILPSFSKLQVGQKFILYITSDTALPEQITIQYGENLIDKIETKIADGELRIRDKNKFNWVRKLNVNPRCTLNIKSINRLNIDGAASVICLDSISSPKIELNMNSVEHQFLKMNVGILSGACENTGNIEFEGNCDILAFSCENGSWFDAKKMTMDDAYVFHYTDRDIFVSQKNIFKPHVYGNGKIYYNLEPTAIFIKEEKGNGRVIKK